MDVEELRPGLWRWTAQHPEWAPENAQGGGWGPIVASYFVEGRDELVLVDPLAPPAGTEEGARVWRALDRDVDRLGPPAILVTIFWHARSSREILERYAGAQLLAHEPAAELIEQRTLVTGVYRVGEALPGGFDAYGAAGHGEVVLWHPGHRAVLTGDILLGPDAGNPLRICPDSWHGGGVTREHAAAALRPLLELPIELLLPTHGEPVTEAAHDALEEVLADS